MDRFLYEVLRFITAELPSFSTGILIGGVASYFITKKIMRLTYHRRVRRTNEYLKKIERQVKILRAMYGMMNFLKNISMTFVENLSMKIIEIDDLKESLEMEEDFKKEKKNGNKGD